MRSAAACIGARGRDERALNAKVDLACCRACWDSICGAHISAPGASTSRVIGDKDMRPAWSPAGAGWRQSGHRAD